MMERPENSISIADEDHLNNKYLLSQWKVWKCEVEKDIQNLLKRVDELEHSDAARNSAVTPDLPCRKSFAQAEDDGFAGLCTCADLVRSDKASFLQCIWLGIFLVVLTIVGATEFRRALDNRDAEFKPEKKNQTIDYGDSEITYEMPYIYLGFYVRDEAGILTENYTVNEIMEYLLSSQDYFQNQAYIKYVNSSLTMVTEDLPISEAEAFYTEESVSDRGFHGYFRLKPSNPDPSIGYFLYAINLKVYNLFIDDIPLKLFGLFVSLSRENATTIRGDMMYISIKNSLDDGSKISAVIEYDEQVTRTLDEGFVYYFRSWVTQNSEEEFRPSQSDHEFYGTVDIMFRGNLMIEWWKEYVDYDYLDYFSAMGGYLSLSSIAFFWVAYFMALKYGEKNTMGILPKMSFAFANFETVNMLRDKLKFL